MSKNGKRKVRLRVVFFATQDDAASEIVLTGDFTGWSRDRIRLDRDPDGHWRARLELVPGEYQYRLIVDGQWADHREATARVPNPFGSENCVLKV